MNLWCLIPARKGSAGVPNKNIRLLPDGTTCLGRAVAMAGKFSTHIVVSTDYRLDELICLRGAGVCGATVIKQPALCASGGGTMLALMLHAMLEVGAAEDDVVLLLQPSSPFRTARTGRRVLGRWLYPHNWHEAGGELCDSVCSVMPVPKTWHPAYVVTPGEPWTPPTRRQDLAPAYRPDGGYYATTVKQLLTGSWGRMGIVESGAGESLTIDTAEDWAEAERRISATVERG